MPDILKAIPNLRDIHSATLGRATPGTGLWIFEWDTFIIWLSPDGYLKILWGYGMPGAGKTILASIVINVLESRSRDSTHPICVCYLYFRYSDRRQATVHSFLQILVRQTAERHPSCLPLVNELYDVHIREGTQPSEDELLSLLRHFSLLMKATFYVLDALDEAPTSVQLNLLTKLATLNVRLFITSRPLKTLESRSPSAHCFPVIARDADIELHIQQEITRSPEVVDILKHTNINLRAHIVASIRSKSTGMFLHASLQLEALREHTSVHDVEQELQNFPSQVEDVYHRTWSRILDFPPHKALLAKTVILWLLYTPRPMTIEELQQAVAVAPETYQFDANRLVQEGTLLGLCRGLVAIEDGSRVVRLVHYTAERLLRQLILTEFLQPHALLAAVCMARLSRSGFQNTSLSSKWAFRNALKEDTFLAYAYTFWWSSARQVMGDPPTAKRVAQFAAGCIAFPVLVGFLQ